MVLFAAAMFIVAGCASTPKPPPKPPTIKVFKLVHHVGGTHYRSLTHNGMHYQTFGSSLLVMRPGEVTPIKSIELAKSGENAEENVGAGPARDMIIDSVHQPPRLFIVIEDDEVLELSLEIPESPAIVSRIGAQPSLDVGDSKNRRASKTLSTSLPIHPRRLSLVDGEIYVSGPGGVVRLSDRKRIFTTDQDVSRIVRGEAGLIACVGSPPARVIRLDNGRYLGSASELLQLDNSAILPSNNLDSPDREITTSQDELGLIFARQGEGGVLVGIMSPDLREIDPQHATVAIPGQFHSLRMIDGRVWIVTDEVIAGYQIAFSDDRTGPDGSGGISLSDPIHIDVLGARDVARVSQNYLAIAGTFGRSVYRLAKDARGPGETFVQVHREPSRLSRALTDGRHILAGSREGLWMYLINSRVELTTRQFETEPPPPQTSATTAAAQARISDDGRSITVTWSDASREPLVVSSELLVESPEQRRAKKNREDTASKDPASTAIALFRCVAAIDGDFWIGHDRGLTVLRVAPIGPGVPKRKLTGSAEDHIAARLRMDGPVLYIYPLLIGGGASFVSEYGGFGVAKFIDEPVK